MITQYKVVQLWRIKIWWCPYWNRGSPFCPWHVVFLREMTGKPGRKNQSNRQNKDVGVFIKPKDDSNKRHQCLSIVFSDINSEKWWHIIKDNSRSHAIQANLIQSSTSGWIPSRKVILNGIDLERIYILAKFIWRDEANVWEKTKQK
jgi:hypothetical protein